MLIFMKTFFFLYLYQDDIIPDLADAFPGDHVFAFSSEKAAESAWTGNNKSSQTAGFVVEFHINGTSKTSAGTGIDNLFLL